MEERKNNILGRVLKKVRGNAVTELSCGVNWFSRTICSWRVGRLPNRQVISQSQSDLIWQHCYSQSYQDCLSFYFSSFCTLLRNFLYALQADCRYAPTVEPIKTDGSKVSLSKHKLLHSHNSAAEQWVMDTDNITMLSLSLEVYSIREGVMLDPQSWLWCDKQSDRLHPVTLC